MIKYHHFKTMKFELNDRVLTVMFNAPEKPQPEACCDGGDGCKCRV